VAEIRVRLRAKTRALDAVEGWSLLEILKAHRLPVPGTCGGHLECGSCRIEIAQEWSARLPPPADDERALAAGLPGATALSRLACQVIFEEGLDGLALELPLPAA
jgi:2Fe-2S ferredoxin